MIVPPETVVGKICHIRGDKPKSKRHDRNQTEARRQGVDNLILLCGFHHDVIDGDDATYTVEVLCQMKLTHEAKATKKFVISDNVAKDALLVMAGGAAMFGFSEIAKEVGAVVGAIKRMFQTEPETTTDQPQHRANENLIREIVEMLRYAPKGQFLFRARSERDRTFGTIEGWEIRWQTSGASCRENADVHLIVVPASSRDPYSACDLILRINTTRGVVGPGSGPGRRFASLALPQNPAILSQPPAANDKGRTSA